jgi:hypothetical protein
LGDFLGAIASEVAIITPSSEQRTAQALIVGMRLVCDAERDRMISILDSSSLPYRVTQLHRGMQNVDAAMSYVHVRSGWQQEAQGSVLRDMQRIMGWRQAYLEMEGSRRGVDAEVAQLELQRHMQRSQQKALLIEEMQHDAQNASAEHEGIVTDFRPLSGKRLRSSEYWPLFGALTGHPAPGGPTEVLKPSLDKIAASELIGNLQALCLLAESHADDVALRSTFHRLLEAEREITDRYTTLAATLAQGGHRPRAVLPKSIVARTRDIQQNWNALKPVMEAHLPDSIMQYIGRVGIMLEDTLHDK